MYAGRLSVFVSSGEEAFVIRKLAFDEVVEAIEGLSADDQMELVHLIRRRLAENGRRRVMADVHEAKAEMQSGQARRLDLDELARELG
jgi:hypothetical protein